MHTRLLGARLSAQTLDDVVTASRRQQCAKDPGGIVNCVDRTCFHSVEMAAESLL